MNGNRHRGNALAGNGFAEQLQHEPLADVPIRGLGIDSAVLRQQIRERNLVEILNRIDPPVIKTIGPTRGDDDALIENRLRRCRSAAVIALGILSLLLAQLPFLYGGTFPTELSTGKPNRVSRSARHIQDFVRLLFKHNSKPGDYLFTVEARD